MLCEKKREIVFNGGRRTTRGNTDHKGLQRETTVFRSSDGKFRHPSAATMATTHTKRRRSQGEEDVVKIRRSASTDVYSFDRGATSTPTTSGDDQGHNVANLTSIMSTPSSAYQMAFDGGDAVFPSRPPAQHGDHNFLSNSHHSHVAQRVTNTIGRISDNGIDGLMKSAYDELQKLSNDICRMTNTNFFPHQILMGQSSNRLVNQLVLSLFSTDARSETDWRKSRLQRAGSLAVENVLCAMIGAMIQCILLPGAEREHLPVKFFPEFEGLIESVKRVVSAPYVSSQDLHARFNAVPVPATFDTIVEAEAVKLSTEAMKLVDELAPVLPSCGPLDIGAMDKWESRLRIIFSRLLVLKLRLEICNNSYKVIWPNKGGPLDRSEMEQIEPTDTPQDVAFPCFPGIETRAPTYAPIVARHAMVETIDRRIIDTAETLRAIAYARNVE